MLRKDLALDSLQLSMMGFLPCVDADIREKVADGYGDSYVVMTLFLDEKETHHIFQKSNENYLYVQQL